MCLSQKNMNLMKHIFKGRPLRRIFYDVKPQKASFPQEPLSIFSYDDKPLPQPNQDLCLHPPLGM